MNLSKEKIENIMKLIIEEVDIAIKDGNSPFAAFLLDMDGNNYIKHIILLILILIQLRMQRLI